jgi:coenzyme F420 hydrogenase subunit beta
MQYTVTMKLKNAHQVAEWRLCIGCGACKYICPASNITLSDILNEGIRPIISSGNCTDCVKCVSVCPGAAIEHRYQEKESYLSDLMQGWGPVLEVWEGYAADPEIRYNGSSGGLASALALYCIEKGGMHGILHIGPDDNKPLRNKTVFSTSRHEIVARTGSRYSPASPCDGLDKIANAPGLCVFIGKPCDVTAVRKAQFLKPELNKNVGITIGIFCAGTPSTQGTIDLLRMNGIDPDSVKEIRYRGKGWPGKFSIKLKGEEQPREVMTYMDSWGFVQKYRPYRCHLCPDGTGEFADISCGDPWYRQIQADEQGYSLVLVRTEKGREILHEAMEAGYVVLKKASPRILEDSQKNLLAKRVAVWGRLLAMKAFGIPTPRLEGFSLYKNWLRISFKDKARSILGTARRIIQRGYYKPIKKGFS